MFEEKSKKRRKSIVNKIQLIGWIVVDYLTNLFNRNSRDYREVSRKLAEMKSQDKFLQLERLRAETTTGVNSFYSKSSIISFSFLF